MTKRKGRPKALIHHRLGRPPGSYSVSDVVIDQWGWRVTVHCRYGHPPTDIAMQLIFNGCSSIQCYTQNPTKLIQSGGTVPLITHDLGAAQYQYTARLVTSRVELIISYNTLELVIDDADSTAD